MAFDDFHLPLKFGPHIVPGLWRYLLPDDVQYFHHPTEGRSTCNQCPLVEEEGFHPTYRCCTYIPRLPNYNLGFALENAASAARVQHLIANGFATPEGLQATTLQSVAALEQISNNQFGRDAKVVCPFLDMENHQCGMYLYRNSVCATFFCKHDHGEDGKDYWEKLQAVAGQVEMALVQWVMKELGLPPKEYFAAFDNWADRLSESANPSTRAWTPEFLDSIWGPYRGREAEFYAQSAQLVRDNKDKLYEIARQTPILQPNAYNRAFHAHLPPAEQRAQDAEGPTEGEPVPISDLMYLVEVASSRLARRQVEAPPK